MKAFFAVLVMLIGLVNVAFAADNGLSTEISVAQGTPAISPYYFGAGLVELKSVAFPVTRNEANYIMNYGGVRTESPRRLAKNLTFGYREENVSLEVSYTFDDPGAMAETRGTAVGYNYFTGQQVSAPMSIQHTEKYSAWQISTLIEHKLNESVMLVGKIGFTSSQIVSETRTAYVCVTACAGYSGESKTVNDTSITYGVGIKAKVMNRTNGDVWARLMVEKLPNGFMTSRADVLFPF